MEPEETIPFAIRNSTDKRSERMWEKTGKWLLYRIQRFVLHQKDNEELLKSFKQEVIIWLAFLKYHPICSVKIALERKRDGCDG